MVSDLCKHSSRLNKLNSLGTVTCYSRPDDYRQHSLSVLFFCDAGKTVDAAQLSFIRGLLIDSINSSSHTHVISWVSHKARWPVKSIRAAETLAASEANDTGKSICAVYHILCGIDINLLTALDTKYLYTSLATPQKFIDPLIWGYVIVIRYEFETRSRHEAVWIPEKLNLADYGTMFDSPLNSVLNQMLQTGRWLPFSFDNAESCPSDKPFG